MTPQPGATIFMLDADQNLTALEPTDFANEAAFQDLLARHPPLLSLAAGSDAAGLLLVAREAGVADDEGAPDRWSIDHLFLNREGVPVLVEVKRARDPRARREVVAQMLDYAAHGTAYWSAREIESMYRETASASDSDADAVLTKFLDGRESEQFWRQVEANLRAGRIRMLFVADKIGKELRRIVEFLNEQMRPAEVLAVEISQFANDKGVRTLVPTLIGATERAQSTKIVSSPSAPVSPSEWLAGFAARHGGQTGDAALRAADFFQNEAGLAMRIVASQKSAAFEIALGAESTCALFYLIREPAGLQIAVQSLAKLPAFAADISRAAIVDELKALDLGSRNEPADPARSFPTVPLSALISDEVWSRLKPLLLSIVGKARPGGASTD
jgi:hypothetical protein